MSHAPTPRATLYRSAGLAVALQWSVRLIGLVSVFILAHLLTPGDFGIIGLAVGALALVELLGAIGLRQALLRIPEPERDHLDTAWTIQIILSTTIGIVGVAWASSVAGFYGEPRLAPVMMVLSCRFFLYGVANVGIVEFERRFDFGRDLRMRLACRLIAFVITIAAAFLLRNYWALVIGLVTSAFCFTVATYVCHPFRPRFSLRRRAELLGTSIWILVNSAAQTVQEQVERLVIGRFAGAHTLGLFSVSKDLAEIFAHEIATALNRVTFVTVARTGEPLSQTPLRTAQILGAYAIIAAPLGFGLAATAENSIVILLGWKWIEAAPFLEIVAVYSAFFAVYKVIASALTAAGRGRQAAAVSGAGAVCLVAAVAGAAYLRPDAMTVAFAAMAANFVVLAGGIVVMARASSQGAAALALHVARPFAAAAAMLAAVRLLGPDSGEPLLDLPVEIAIGVLLYPAFVYALWRLSGRPAGGETEAVLLAGELRAGLARRLRAAPKEA